MPQVTSILAAASLIGGGLSAWGQIKEGQEQRQANEYNAQISEQEAGVVRQNQVLNEYRQRKQLKQDVGSMTAAVAKSGIEMTGSPLDVIKDSIANAELDIDIGKYNSEVEARGKENDARLRRYYGQQDESLSYVKAASTLLATGATAYDRYSKRVPSKTKLGEGVK